MFKFGFDDGKGPTVPLKLIGIPFKVPSVLLKVKILSANVKLITGFVIFWSKPENAGLVNDPEIIGLAVVPLRVAAAVMIPDNL